MCCPWDIHNYGYFLTSNHNLSISSVLIGFGWSQVVWLFLATGIKTNKQINVNFTSLFQSFY